MFQFLVEEVRYCVEYDQKETPKSRRQGRAIAAQGYSRSTPEKSGFHKGLHAHAKARADKSAKHHKAMGLSSKESDDERADQYRQTIRSGRDSVQMKQGHDELARRADRKKEVGAKAFSKETIRKRRDGETRDIAGGVGKLRRTPPPTPRDARRLRRRST